MKALKRHEGRYIVSKGIEESILSQNAYVPKELKVDGKSYAFFVDEEAGYIEVMLIYGAKREESLADSWKIPV